MPDYAITLGGAAYMVMPGGHRLAAGSPGGARVGRQRVTAADGVLASLGALPDRAGGVGPGPAAQIVAGSITSGQPALCASDGEYLFIASGTTLYRWDRAVGHAPATRATLPAAATCLTRANGLLFIGFGAAADVASWNDATATLTSSALGAGVKASMLGAADLILGMERMHVREAVVRYLAPERVGRAEPRQVTARELAARWQTLPHLTPEDAAAFADDIARTGDPVDAWAAIVEDPEKAHAYKSQRGRGGFVRSSWDEVSEIIAAAHIHTIKRYGPDRNVGFSPIPAMSAVSYAAGTRFLSLTGGVCLSFYDWYADLPPASPQVWGDQTDVPESADWWDASYLMLWGSNIPQTRTPDAHFMTEARYRGQKVIVVSPDYAGSTKFADQWLPATAGTDGALAMGMGHVILKEFFVDREAEYFGDYARKFTDMPFLVTLDDHGDGTWRGGAMLRAADIGEEGENDEWKTVLIDSRTGEPVVPNGTIGDRWGEEGMGKWNLDLEGVEPALSLFGSHDELVEVSLPRFDGGETEGGTTMRRGVPARRIGNRLVTTVFDLALAQYGVAREGMPGTWPSGYDDASEPYTPAWQAEQTGVDAKVCEQVAREFAQNAERTRGRSMIVMGAGTNHWFHSDQTYRAMLSLVLFCGCQGVNGGGWAHYVGQEKVRPITGWQTLAFALDWNRPPRQQAATPFWYLASEQWRYETHGAEEFTSPAGPNKLGKRHTADCYAQAVRLGWTPAAPAFNRNPLDLADEAKAAGRDPVEYVVDELKSGELAYACEDPGDPANFPRILSLWRANLIGSSAKGQEYFLKHLLGVPDAGVRSEESGPEERPRDVRWRDEAAEGKLDLFMTVDFRMNGSCLYSDVVLPAATWYEKHDISSTDLHPFVHPFNAAIPPPWEAKTDWETFNLIARKFSELAVDHLGTRTDIVSPGISASSAPKMAAWRKRLAIPRASKG